MRSARRSPRIHPTEHQIQSAVFEWRDKAIATWPELGLLFAIPNGAKLPFVKKFSARAGKLIRHCPQAILLKAEGMTPGVWDCFFSVPRGRFHGLYVEHKSEGNDVSTEQVDFGALAAEAGYDTFVSWDAADTIAKIEAYWALGPFNQGATP